jgi:Flp pilus assembly pilin Flp
MQHREGVTAVRRPEQQSGATAIEFAFVLPMLIALTYAIFVYSYVYVVYEALNYAAQQGSRVGSRRRPRARHRLSVDRAPRTRRPRRAGVLSWLPESQIASSVGDNGSIDPGDCSATSSARWVPAPYCPVAPIRRRADRGQNQLSVDQSFSSAMNLPGIGNVPPLPTSQS